MYCAIHLMNLFFLLLTITSSEVVKETPVKTRLQLDMDFRAAIVLTIAGKLKLSEYFDWTCTSISHSSVLFDLIVFHEGNKELLKREKEKVCAPNVKFIDLGENGLSHMIVDLIIETDKSLSQVSNRDATATELISILSEVITNIPRYLVEVKPM